MVRGTQLCQPRRFGNFECGSFSLQHFTVQWPATEKVLYFRVRLVTSMTTSVMERGAEPTSAWTTTSTCIATEYLQTRTGSPSVSTFSCVECMDGAECASRLSDTLGTRPGYWRPTFDEIVYYPCVEGLGDCTGGTLSRNATHADVQCRQGHTGPLCAVCLANHARDVDNAMHAVSTR